MVDEMLRADLRALPKKRHAAKRVFDRLVEEYRDTDISYGMVRAHVDERREEIRLAAGLGVARAFVRRSRSAR
ncbi:hypothetical protein AB0I16_17290 [Streptomyces sp. NPDC050703]|uniref:hypothetical protein n=1 Tax=Streptomyces sp. NPDC050703 TaxID=3157218 RepID=UPI00344205B4